MVDHTAVTITTNVRAIIAIRTNSPTLTYSFPKIFTYLCSSLFFPFFHRRSMVPSNGQFMPMNFTMVTVLFSWSTVSIDGLYIPRWLPFNSFCFKFHFIIIGTVRNNRTQNVPQLFFFLIKEQQRTSFIFKARHLDMVSAWTANECARSRRPVVNEWNRTKLLSSISDNESTRYRSAKQSYLARTTERKFATAKFRGSARSNLTGVMSLFANTSTSESPVAGCNNDSEISVHANEECTLLILERAERELTGGNFSSVLARRPSPISVVLDTDTPR